MGGPKSGILTAGVAPFLANDGRLQRIRRHYQRHELDVIERVGDLHSNGVTLTLGVGVGVGGKGVGVTVGVGVEPMTSLV